jgi:soluble lytic murein transglycosylase-like protein
MWWTLLVAGALAKDIYRATLPDGRTVFTDQRRDASAEVYLLDTPSKVLVAPVSTRGVPLLDAWDDRFVAASLRYGVAAELLKAVCLAESAMNPSARSYKGAMGLMQLMPGTARLVVKNYSSDQMGANFYDPSTNIALGQAYIASLLGEVDNNLVRTAAGYNGGPGNVMRWDNSLNASQDPLLYVASIPLNETRDFVQRVLANYWMYQIRLGQPTPSLDQIAAHEWPRYTPQDTGR